MQISRSTILLLAVLGSCKSTEHARVPITVTAAEQPGDAGVPGTTSPASVARAADAAVEAKPIWNKDPDGITLLSASRRVRSVTVERHKGTLRIKDRELYNPRSHNAKFSEGGEDWVRFWAAPSPLRDLGHFDEKMRDEVLPLGSTGTITISWGAETRRLEFGPGVAGTGERYVLDLDTRQLYLFDANTIFFP